MLVLWLVLAEVLDAEVDVLELVDEILVLVDRLVLLEVELTDVLVDCDVLEDVEL